MSALAKSPLADAMREAGLSEKQIAAALEAAEKQPVVTRLDEVCARAIALGMRAEVVRDVGSDWVRMAYDFDPMRANTGVICFWAASGERGRDHWSLDVGTSRPDEAPSLMQRAQTLHDLYRQLVSP